MMIVTEQVLDQLTEEAKKSIRLRQHFDLRNSSEDNSQRMLNALEPGTVIPVHRHRNTSEVVSVIRGSVRQNFYDNNGTLIESFIVAAGESLPLFVVPMGIIWKPCNRVLLFSRLKMGCMHLYCQRMFYNIMYAEGAGLGKWMSINKVLIFS